MQSDPLMPASGRFPRIAAPQGSRGETPTAARPFVLRGAVTGGLREAKHRTGATTVKHTQPTTSDGKDPTTITDTYSTPDD